MTSKKESSKLTLSNSAKVSEIEPPRKAKDYASLLTNSAFPSTVIISSYGGKTTNPEDILSRLHGQADSVLEGDTSQLETMQLHQAIALQSIFSELAVRARSHKDMSAVQTLTQLALRAQSNSRATIQTLAEVKNPKQVAFVKQANIAQNQQVNNGVSSLARARKDQVKPNELIAEVNHGSKKMDTRTKKTAGRADTNLDAVDAVDRTAKSPRKTQSIT